MTTKWPSSPDHQNCSFVRLHFIFPPKPTNRFSPCLSGHMHTLRNHTSQGGEENTHKYTASVQTCTDAHTHEPRRMMTYGHPRRRGGGEMDGARKGLAVCALVCVRRRACECALALSVVFPKPAKLPFHEEAILSLCLSECETEREK